MGKCGEVEGITEGFRNRRDDIALVFQRYVLLIFYFFL